jgi:hypothetical protein
MGLQGLTGAAGTNGTNGLAGATGPAGADGAAGVAGSPGLPGADGAAGTNGTNGLAGADGAAGVAGLQGPQGPIGPVGLLGLNGTDGTNGANGVDGAAGVAGAPGPQGPAGADSTVAGPPGPQGPAGADGAGGGAVLKDNLNQTIGTLLYAPYYGDPEVNVVADGVAVTLGVSPSGWTVTKSFTTSFTGPNCTGTAYIEVDPGSFTQMAGSVDGVIYAGDVGGVNVIVPVASQYIGYYQSCSDFGGTNDFGPGPPARILDLSGFVPPFHLE